MKKMNRWRLLWKIIKRCKADRILYQFIINFFVVALLVMWAEPDIHTYRESLWYLYVACSTIGFGDFAAVTWIGRILTVYISISEIVLVAIIPGVVVSYYMEVVHRREKESVTMFLEKLEHLPELSKEELAEISEKVKKMNR